MILRTYHGTDNPDQILENGFDLSYAGTGWGLTYGRGIYFATDLEEAKVYGNTVLKCEIRYRPFRLKRDYSPSNRNRLSKLKELAIESGHNCFLTKNRKEIVLFDPYDVISIDVLNLETT